jgi:hypothetical protein
MGIGFGLFMGFIINSTIQVKDNENALLMNFCKEKNFQAVNNFGQLTNPSDSSKYYEFVTCQSSQFNQTSVSYSTTSHTFLVSFQYQDAFHRNLTDSGEGFVSNIEDIDGGNV